MKKVYESSAAKQRAYRQRCNPMKGTLTRIRRFLSLHPEQVKAVDAFMLGLALTVKKRQIAKADEWPDGRKVSMDYNEDRDPNS